jgi:hypothetical protein
MNLYSASRFLEDPIGLNRPLWRDYSRYQGEVNAAIAVANGVHGMAHRCGISWGYHDAWFQTNYASFDELAYRTSYHVPYPDQPIIAQLDKVWYFEHPEIEIIPRIIDSEVSRNQHPEKIAEFTWDMSEIIKSRDGVRPIIYSRKGLIDAWFSPYWTDDMLNDHYWWLAQYLFLPNEHPGPPDLPDKIRRDRVIMHQTSHKKPGFPGEVESRSVDWDRWELGSEREMYQFIAREWGEAPLPPPTDCTCLDEITALDVRVSALEEIVL